MNSFSALYEQLHYCPLDEIDFPGGNCTIINFLEALPSKSLREIISNIFNLYEHCRLRKSVENIYRNFLLAPDPTLRPLKLIFNFLVAQADLNHIKLLLENGVSPHTQYSIYPPLYDRKSGDIYYSTASALHTLVATRKKNNSSIFTFQEILKLLIENGVDIHTRALVKGCSRNNFFVKEGDQVNKNQPKRLKNKYLKTAREIAYEQKDFEMVRILNNYE